MLYYYLLPVCMHKQNLKQITIIYRICYVTLHFLPPIVTLNISFQVIDTMANE